LTTWFGDLRASDVATVGGKNASLGEMYASLSKIGIRVPDGFAVTAEAYWAVLDANDLRTPIARLLDRFREDPATLQAVGAAIRELVEGARFPEELTGAIVDAYRSLARRAGVADLAVAVRSSATAEDLPEASFAGQHESFLNVSGDADVVDAVRACMASLFTDRAISYRDTNGFDHMKVALSVGVQRMVRSDSGSAGVMFTLDTETGFPDVVQIDASWGLGEAVVRGTVSPDRYTVFKPLLADGDLRPVISTALGEKAEKVVDDPGGAGTSTVATDEDERSRFVLTTDEVLQLARWAVAIEDHYGRPMDIEWAKDGRTNELFVVQARPETVQARRVRRTLTSYTLGSTGPLLASGIAIGAGVTTGPVQKITTSAEVATFTAGSVLVTEMTDPDWVPIMRRAAAIVTDRGGRTSHAAIISRELGVAAVIGAGDATSTLSDGQIVTVSCAEGEVGHVYEGAADVTEVEIDLDDLPASRTKVMLNLADPAGAMRWWQLGADGVGLARMEFIVGNHIKIHPMALADVDAVTDERVRDEIRRRCRGFDDPASFFVDTLAAGIAGIAAPMFPEPVIVRLSDFKTNEYATLIGGDQFEPAEANPMLGWRGASRYHDPGYRAGFALECAALRKVRDEMGFTNVVVMVPFCRTLAEADQVLAVMADEGLRRGDRGLQVFVMAEIPSNFLLAAEFCDRFDGFSIGSNDLTQLVLGIDRDSQRLAPQFDERNPAVLRLIRELVEVAHERGRVVGLCGQAPSDHPDFARLLADIGVDSISVTPDSFAAVRRAVALAE
jgi:pyruvate,water dikinase